jgi:hypothetical protein
MNKKPPNPWMAQTLEIISYMILKYPADPYRELVTGKFGGKTRQNFIPP